MTDKTYKGIFVPVKVHKKLKVRALKEDKTMIELLEELLSVK
jgi:hypothetical protein